MGVYPSMLLGQTERKTPRFFETEGGYCRQDSRTISNQCKLEVKSFPKTALTMRMN